MRLEAVVTNIGKVSLDYVKPKFEASFEKELATLAQHFISETEAYLERKGRLSDDDREKILDAVLEQYIKPFESYGITPARLACLYDVSLLELKANLLEKVEELASGEEQQEPAFERYLDEVKTLLDDKTTSEESMILEGLALRYMEVREEGKADVVRDEELDSPEWQSSIFDEALKRYAKVHNIDGPSVVLDVLSESCGGREEVKARVIQRALQLRVKAKIGQLDSSFVQTVRDACPWLGDFSHVTRELAPSLYSGDQAEYLGHS